MDQWGLGLPEQPEFVLLRTPRVQFLMPNVPLASWSSAGRSLSGNGGRGFSIWTTFTRLMAEMLQSVRIWHCGGIPYLRRCSRDGHCRSLVLLVLETDRGGGHPARGAGILVLDFFVIIVLKRWHGSAPRRKSSSGSGSQFVSAKELGPGI